MERKRALFVDDNKVSQTVATALLNGLEMEVHTADDCAEAISAIERHKYQIVFLDCLMFAPEYEEISAALKRCSLDVPIIGMVTTTDTKTSEHCLAAGMAGYINKPLERRALEESIKLAMRSESLTQLSEVPAVRAEAIKPQTLNIGLLRESFSEASIKDLLAFFADTAPDEVRGIIDAVVASNYTEAKRMLHTFKGSCATIYAEAFAQACLELEDEIKKIDQLSQNDTINHSSSKSINKLIAELNTQLNTALNAVSTYLLI